MSDFRIDSFAALAASFVAEVDARAEGLDRIASTGHPPARFAAIRDPVVHLAPAGSNRPLCSVRASGWQSDPGGRRLCARCIVRLLETSSGANSRPKHTGQTPESPDTQGREQRTPTRLTNSHEQEGEP